MAVPCAVLLLIVAGALAVHRTRSPRPPTPYTPAHGAFLAELGEEVPFEVRLWGAGRMRDQATVPKGAPALAFSGRELLAELAIDRDLADNPGPETWAASGVRYLVAGAFDRAIADLERALLDHPDDPRILNDLAAAYLASAGTDNRPWLLLDALDLAWLASVTAPDSPEPIFNLASGLDSLHLRKGARSSWERLLEVDASDSPWTELARRRIRELQKPTRAERWQDLRHVLRSAAAVGDVAEVRRLVATYPEQSWEEVEDWLFTSWPEAVSAGDAAGADDLVNAARFVASVLRADRGGGFLGAVTQELRSAPVSGPTARKLALAYRELGAGLAGIERLEVDETSELLASSRARLKGLDSVYFARALLLSSYCQFMETAYPEAVALAQEAGRLARRYGDQKTIVGSLQLLGVIESVRGRPEAALALYRSAFEFSEELGWEGASAALQGLHGEILSLLGDDRTAWRHRLQALAGLDAVHRPRIRFRILHEAAEGALQRSPVAARFMADALVDSAAQTGLPTTSIIALKTRASINSRLDRTSSALGDLEAAEAWTDDLRDRPAAESLRGNILLERAQILMADRPAQVLEILDETESLFRLTRFKTGLPWVLQARAGARRLLGDDVGAEKDLARAIGITATEGASVVEPARRAELASRSRGLYDAMIDLQLALGRPERALEFVEASRWPLLWTEASAAGREPRIELGGLPPGAAVLAYRSLPESLAVWALRGQETRSAVVPISPEELQDRVARIRQLILWGDRLDLEAEGLYSLLVAPVESALEGISTVFVVSDGSLDGFPLGALRNPATGRYLLEDASVLASRSVATAIGAAGHGDYGRVFGPSARLLVVAEPQPWSGLDVSVLPRSGVEARRIAELFPRTTLLRGDAANEAELLARLGGQDALHFAGHALSGRGGSLSASLLLSPSPGGYGLVSAEEILANAPLDLSLVVLSACGSASADPAGGAGTALPTAFLESGVPAVVAALWEVADRPSAELFGHFYESLQTGHGPAEALRAAQLQALNSSDPVLSAPKTWAAFQMYSSGAK